MLTHIAKAPAKELQTHRFHGLDCPVSSPTVHRLSMYTNGFLQGAAYLLPLELSLLNELCQDALKLSVQSYQLCILEGTSLPCESPLL